MKRKTMAGALVVVSLETLRRLDEKAITEIVGKTPPAVYSAVRSAVGSAVDSAVRSAVGSAVGSAVDSAVGFRLRAPRLF